MHDYDIIVDSVVLSQKEMKQQQLKNCNVIQNKSHFISLLHMLIFRWKQKNNNYDNSNIMKQSNAYCTALWYGRCSRWRYSAVCNICEWHFFFSTAYAIGMHLALWHRDTFAKKKTKMLVVVDGCCYSSIFCPLQSRPFPNQKKKNKKRIEHAHSFCPTPNMSNWIKIVDKFSDSTTFLFVLCLCLLFLDIWNRS